MVNYGTSSYSLILMFPALSNILFEDTFLGRDPSPVISDVGHNQIIGSIK